MFAGALTALAVISYVAVSFCFPFYFASGPVAFAKIMMFGKLAEAADLIAPVLWGCIPLVFCYICRFFGAPVTLPQALTSAILFVLSWPIAILVRRLFEEKGSPDAIHALKSGFVIPFLIISLAYPLMRISSRPGAKRTETSEAAT